MAKICISQGQALEERLSNLHEQMAGVTSRLDQTERELDLERATREEVPQKEKKWQKLRWLKGHRSPEINLLGVGYRGTTR